VSQIEIKNAVIESALITTEERGFLDCWLTFTYGDSSGQGFGGFTLYLPKSWSHHKMMSPAGHFIFRVMEIADVTDFSKLKGRSIRVKAEHNKVHAIGHIIKDDWFDPSEDFKKLDKGEDQ
jgi:hypothetical protein